MLKEPDHVPHIHTIIKKIGSKLPKQKSKELISPMSDQMVLNKFKETARSRSQGKGSFRKPVYNLIVFTVDMTK